MVQHVNFYENVQEASMRLRKTIVMYEDEPYFVMAVSDHKVGLDGKLRIYLDKLGYPSGLGRNRNPDLPPYQDMHHTEVGPALDEWLNQPGNLNKGILRRYLGAAGFNKFRPFPLGNMNTPEGGVVYCERTPTRNTFQGLRGEAIIGTNVSIAPDRASQPSKKPVYSNSSYNRGLLYPVDELSIPFYDCIMGNYPSFQDVIENLQDPEILNTGVAFHREFSVHRGPLNMLFLCYRHEGIGLLTTFNHPSRPNVTLSKDFEFLRETLEELDIFNYISIKE